MKELKIKTLWAVDIDTIQFKCFKYKKDAKIYAKNKEGIFGSSPQIIKRKVITDKY
jgi:hypothetical protein